MNISLLFTRVFFVILSVFFMTTYMVASYEASAIKGAAMGISLGLAFGILLMGFDQLFRRFNLRSFNIALVGLFIGYLMGNGILLVFNEVIKLGHLENTISSQALAIIKIGIFLFATYLGTVMMLKAADEFYVSIPFVRFATKMYKKKDLLIDVTTLYDPRIYDLCATSILDDQLIIPQFIVKELYAQAEASDESMSSKARKALDIIKKLQSVESLGLRFNETDFPEVKDLQTKMLRLARLLEAYILTADNTKLQSGINDGIKVININSLSTALKPMMQAGELIKIKVQRIGKEPRQGVGYLEDGTMVVINGGGNFLGDIIEARVLSVKHTTSGRMIFCNAIDEDLGFAREETEEIFDERT